MHIGDEYSSLEMTPMERFGQALPGDLRLRVSVHAGGFQGSYDQVWVSAPEFEDFVRELARVHETRRGQATLESMSPGEFELVIAAIDGMGHIVARGFLAGSDASRPEMGQSRVSFDVEVDAAELPQLFSALRALPEEAPFHGPSAR
jgi:hypothetical protein